MHIFVRTSDANHLSINFSEFGEVHAARGTDYILSKVQGQLQHGGGVQLTAGSTDFNSLADFLALLDDVPAEGSASGLTDGNQDDSLADPDLLDTPGGVETEDSYDDYYGNQ